VLTAEQSSANCIAIAESLGNPSTIAQSYCTLGLVQVENHDYKKAEVTYGQAIRILEPIDSAFGIDSRHEIATPLPDFPGAAGPQ
jgi:hypothetical protein